MTAAGLLAGRHVVVVVGARLDGEQVAFLQAALGGVEVLELLQVQLADHRHALRPLTTVVIGLSIVASLKTFDIVLGMTKGGPGRVSETLALTMYNDTFVDSQYGLGSAIAVFLTVVTLLASILYLRQQLSKKNEF